MARGTTKKKAKDENHSTKSPLSDKDIEDLVSSLWENIDSLPIHVQTLLHDSQDPGPTGAVSYMLLAGWVIGKIDYVPANPWNGTKAGWVSIMSSSSPS